MCELRLPIKQRGRSVSYAPDEREMKSALSKQRCSVNLIESVCCFYYNT